MKVEASRPPQRQRQPPPQRQPLRQHQRQPQRQYYRDVPLKRVQAETTTTLPDDQGYVDTATFEALQRRNQELLEENSRLKNEVKELQDLLLETQAQVCGVSERVQKANKIINHLETAIKKDRLSTMVRDTDLPLRLIEDRSIQFVSDMSHLGELIRESYDVLPILPPAYLAIDKIVHEDQYQLIEHCECQNEDLLKIRLKNNRGGFLSIKYDMLTPELRRRIIASWLPNIVTFFSLVEDGSFLVENTTTSLADIMKRSLSSNSFCTRWQLRGSGIGFYNIMIGLQIAEAVESLHKLKILHGGLQASKVRIVELDQQILALLDGLIANYELGGFYEDRYLYRSSGVVEPDEARYLAPELTMEDTNVDYFAAEVYALGVILIEILTASPVSGVFDGYGYPTELYQINNNGLQVLIGNCFSASPYERPTAYELAAGLRNIFESIARPSDDYLDVEKLTQNVVFSVLLGKQG